VLQHALIFVQVFSDEFLDRFL